jgi:hypothetical protein
MKSNNGVSFSERMKSPQRWYRLTVTVSQFWENFVPEVKNGGRTCPKKSILRLIFNQSSEYRFVLLPRCAFCSSVNSAIPSIVAVPVPIPKNNNAPLSRYPSSILQQPPENQRGLRNETVAEQVNEC